MILAIDFDGTIVHQEHEYDDLSTPLTFMPGAKAALADLKEAGHILILFSARSNPWLIRDPELDPLVLAGIRKARSRDLRINQARYLQMIGFVKEHLPGVFDLIWEHQGKPSADVFIDDRALQFGARGGTNWKTIARTFGEQG